MTNVKWLVIPAMVLVAALVLWPAMGQTPAAPQPGATANVPPASEPATTEPAATEPPATGAENVKPGGMFEDWSAKLGLNKIDGNQGMVFVDLTENGWPNLVIGGWDVYVNEKGQKLTHLPVQKEFLATKLPVTKESPPPRPQGVIFGHISGSPHLDMYAFFETNKKDPNFKDTGRRNEIWLGDGKGHFTLKKDAGLCTEPQSTGAACLFEMNGDGKLDLFVGNWIEGNGAGESYLYKGKGDGTFTDVTEKAGLKMEDSQGTPKSRRPIFAVTHTDWNNSGKQSLLVGTYAGMWNQLYRNNGDGTFTDVGGETEFDCDHQARQFAQGSPYNQLINICTFSLPVADFNCSGNMSVFVSTIRHWDVLGIPQQGIQYHMFRIYDPSNMLINQGKAQGYKFLHDQLRIPRPAVKLGQQQNWGDLHATWIDVDNDGWEDLIIASSDYPDEQLLKLYHQIPDGSGRFEDWTDKLGFKWVRRAISRWPTSPATARRTS